MANSFSINNVTSVGYRMMKAVLTLFLAGLGLLLLFWFMRGPVIIWATPPIEGNPISTGNGAEIVTASVGVRAIAVADLDRNGRPDLVLADGAQVRIAANAGGIATAWPLSNTVGSMDGPVVDLATVDLDRDGRPDLAVAASDEAGNSYLVLWQGPGAGTNPFEVTWGVSNTLLSSSAITLSTLAVGDLNGDGAPDLVAAGGDGLIRMWRNPMTGTESFTTTWGSPHVLNAGQGAINQILLADLDRDGRQDIVVVSGGATPMVRLWQNPLASTMPFTTAWSISNTLGTLGSDGLSVVMADYDGNGTPDVAVGDAAGAVTAWSNPLTGAQPFTTSWGTPVSVGNGGAPVGALSSGDFDGDGRPDLAGGTESSPSTVIIWHNPGTPFGGSWPTVTIGTRSNTTYDLAVADFEPDGDLDIVSGEGDAGSGYAVLWPNTLIHRDASFDGTSTAVGALGYHAGMQVGDFDRDGYSDIVTQGSGGSLILWENDGSPFDSGWPRHVINPFGDTRPLVLADIDGDGILDIVAGSTWGTPRLEVWHATGAPFEASSWDSHIIGYLPEIVQAADVGDVDGDGRAEVVAGTTAISVWRYDGDPFASGWISAEVGVVTYSVADLKLSDLNNDGRLDIVFGAWHAPAVGSSPDDERPQSEWIDAYQLRAFRNDGAPFAGGWTVFDLGRDPATRTLEIVYHGYFGATIYSIDVADFNNDGNLDIVTGDGYEGDHQVMVWENDGSPFDGQLWSPTAVGLGPWWETQGDPWLADTVRSVVAVDMNNDGLVDIVSGSDSAEPYEIIYWENSGVPFSELITDTHWIRHDLGATNLNHILAATADLDGDGDMDVVSLAETWSDDVESLRVWQNQGGSVGQVAVDTAPAAFLQGTTRELMRIAVSHHGKVVDHDVELEEWRLTFQDSVGTALTSAQADALFTRLAVYRDANGDGIWQIGDTPVLTVSNPVLTNGVQTFAFTSGDELAAISATQTVTYFVVATLESTASEQTPSAFQIVFDPDAASVVRDRVNGASVSINDTQPITVGPVQASGSVGSVSLSADPTSIPADGISSSVLTATVLDGHAQVVADGTIVTFTTSLGALPTDPYTTTTGAGMATAILTSPTSAGTALITATADSQIATTTVTFTAGSVHHIMVSPAMAVLTPTATQPFTATGYDQYDNEVSGLSFTWTVAFSESGTINSSGMFTAGSTPGTYTDTVQATAGDITGTASVTVVDEAIAGLVATDDSPTVLGQATALTATITAGSNVTYSWAFGDGGVGSGAVVTHTYPAVGVYTAVVTASNSVGVVSSTVSVTITTGTLTQVVVEPSSVIMASGSTQAFSATGYDEYGNVIGDLTFVWNVVNGGGTIDSSGVFTAGTTAGTYPNTVQATAEGVSGYASVTITSDGTDDYLIFLPLILRNWR